MTEERKKLNQQDFVDNVINDMIVMLNPSDKKLHWNINIISQIRNIVNRYFVEDLRLCADGEFYPYIDEEDEDEEDGK